MTSLEWTTTQIKSLIPEPFFLVPGRIISIRTRFRTQPIPIGSGMLLINIHSSSNTYTLLNLLKLFVLNELCNRSCFTD